MNQETGKCVFNRKLAERCSQHYSYTKKFLRDLFSAMYEEFEKYD